MSDLLVTQSYSLTQAQIDWLRAQGERRSRRGASSVLREILDTEIERERTTADKTEAA